MKDRKSTGYGISTYASRTRGGIITVPSGYPRPVKVRFFNVEMDYAIIELCDQRSDLDPIPVSFEEVGPDTDLKVYHYPVDIFNDEHLEDLSQFTAWVKAALPTGHHVSCNNGLYSGSSGVPFLIEGDVLLPCM
jgi:hypothetical protein